MAAPENFYSLFRRKSTPSKHVWHIHGEFDNVGSIMLGHEQYSGYLNRIRNVLTTRVPTEAKATKKRGPYLSKYSTRDSCSKGDVANWVDIFLKSEVHIVDFGFDYTENHLWNLTAEKRRLRKKDVTKIGQAFFHRCSDQEQITIDVARLSIPNALGVGMLDHIESSYAKSCEKCLGHLEMRLNKCG